MLSLIFKLLFCLKSNMKSLLSFKNDCRETCTCHFELWLLRNKCLLLFVNVPLTHKDISDIGMKLLKHPTYPWSDLFSAEQEPNGTVQNCRDQFCSPAGSLRVGRGFLGSSIGANPLRPSNRAVSAPAHVVRIYSHFLEGLQYSTLRLPCSSPQPLGMKK